MGSVLAGEESASAEANSSGLKLSSRSTVSVALGVLIRFLRPTKCGLAKSFVSCISAFRPSNLGLPIVVTPFSTGVLSNRATPCKPSLLREKRLGCGLGDVNKLASKRSSEFSTEWVCFGDFSKRLSP